jgi:hypothetical protein
LTRTVDGLATKVFARTKWLTTSDLSQRPGAAGPKCLTTNDLRYGK